MVAIGCLEIEFPSGDESGARVDKLRNERSKIILVDVVFNNLLIYT